MAVTPFKFPRFSESLKCRNSQEIRGQGSGRIVLKQFSSDTAGYSKSRFELYFRKNASNKIIFQIFFVSYYCGRTIVQSKHFVGQL